MELRRNSRGHRVVTLAERRKILDEIQSGSSPAEAARKYELAMWTVQRWLQHERRTGAAEAVSSDSSGSERTVPAQDFKRLHEELERTRQELKATRKSLARMTVDRDILKEAVEIAGKKKWI